MGSQLLASLKDLASSRQEVLDVDGADYRKPEAHMHDDVITVNIKAKSHDYLAPQSMIAT